MKSGVCVRSGVLRARALCGGDLGDSGWGIPDWTYSEDMSRGEFTGGWDKGLGAGLGDVCREGKVGEEEGLGVKCRINPPPCLEAGMCTAPSHARCAHAVLAAPAGWPGAFPQTCLHGGIISESNVGRSEWKCWFLYCPSALNSH